MTRNVRPALNIFALLLLATLPSLRGAAATKSHAHAATPKSKKSAPPARAATKGKKARIPRTLRTIPVSPLVRENAVARVEANLAATAPTPFLYPTALTPFFQALAAKQAERADPTTTPVTTVRVLQFGDSHTAADIFTGQMRALLQARFGDGGLGFQFPGHPFAGYHLAGSLRSQTPGWLTEGNKFTHLGNGDLGLGGISIATSAPGQTATLETACATLQLHFLEQPGGGRLQFSDNGAPIATIETATPDASATTAAGTFPYTCTPGPHAFAFTTLDRAPVKLLGVVTEQPGATWECLGINGAVAPLILRWNQTLFASYLQQRAPSLIVLAYGTNESGSSAEHLEDYPADLARILATLHQNAPDAAVLIMGPEDRAMSAGRAAGKGSRRGAPRGWHPFTGTDRIIAMQKEACRLHRCAFWDTRRRMGGLGAMQQWVAAGWAQPDRTHLTGTGYRALAEALYADLMSAYNLYQQQPETPAAPTTQESSNGKTPRHP